MSTMQLRASLLLWRRRLDYRELRLEVAQARGDKDRAAHWRRLVTDAQVMVDRRRAQLAPALWHPAAIMLKGLDAGEFVRAGAKIVWHTTEGSTAAGAFGAYAESGSWPHFTFDPHTGDLWQHLPLNRAARALQHPAGTVETNRARAIQVELVGFAQATDAWGEKEYRHIARLARWIEANAGVPRRCTVRFSRSATRMAPAAWLRYEGHCGHQHVPGNEHWDPGAFRIEDVIG